MTHVVLHLAEETIVGIAVALLAADDQRTMAKSWHGGLGVPPTLAELVARGLGKTPASTPAAPSPPPIDRAAAEALISRWEGKIREDQELENQGICSDPGYSFLRGRKQAMTYAIECLRSLLGADQAVAP